MFVGTYLIINHCNNYYRSIPTQNSTESTHHKESIVDCSSNRGKYTDFGKF